MDRKWYQLSNRSHVPLVTTWRTFSLTDCWLSGLPVLYAIMPEAAHVDRCFTKQVSDALDILWTGVYCNTFSERGKRQNEEVRRFKEAVHAKENEVLPFLY